jgi:hypothetical protein
MNLSRHAFLMATGVLFPSLASALSQENPLEKYPTERILKDLKKNLDNGRLYDSCIAYAEELIHREPENAEYHLLLADSCVNRYVSVGVAERLRWILPLDQDSYKQYYKEWEVNQSDPHSLYYGKPQPLPPVLKTYDDKRPYRLTTQLAQEKLKKLKEKASLSYSTALTLTKEDKIHARILHEKCWGELLIFIIEYLIKDEKYDKLSKIELNDKFKIPKNITDDLKKCLELDQKNPFYYQSMGDMLSIICVLTENTMYKSEKSLEYYEKSLEYYEESDLKNKEFLIFYLLIMRTSVLVLKGETVKLDTNLKYFKNNAYYWYLRAICEDKNIPSYDFVKLIDIGNKCSELKKIQYLPKTISLSASIFAIQRIIQPQGRIGGLVMTANSYTYSDKYSKDKDQLILSDCIKRIFFQDDIAIKEIVSSLDIFSFNNLSITLLSGFIYKIFEKTREKSKKEEEKDEFQNVKDSESLKKIILNKIRRLFIYRVDNIIDNIQSETF